MKIVLLDLNATLVENTEVHSLPYIYNIPLENYRSWLISLVKRHHVILLTARPKRYEQETLERLRALEEWCPDEWYFNDGFLKAAQTKERMLKEFIFPRHGVANNYIALESNSLTRAMYKSHRIAVYTQAELLTNPSVLDLKDQGDQLIL